VGGRKLDDFKELGGKLKVVSCGLEKLVIPSYLIRIINNMYCSKLDPNKPLEATV